MTRPYWYNYILNAMRGPSGYNAIHERIKRVRGKASERRCVSCGHPADEWALRDDAIFVNYGEDRYGYPRKWGVRMVDYDPMCKMCHEEHDKAHTKTHCRNGHEYAKVGKDKKNGCLQCYKNAMRRGIEKRKRNNEKA